MKQSSSQVKGRDDIPKSAICADFSVIGEFILDCHTVVTKRLQAYYTAMLFIQDSWKAK